MLSKIITIRVTPEHVKRSESYLSNTRCPLAISAQESLHNSDIVVDLFAIYSSYPNTYTYILDKPFNREEYNKVEAGDIFETTATLID